MSDNPPTGSVGIVATQRVRIELPKEGFRLESGDVLPELEIAFETYGELSPQRDNAVFICHALSGDAHVAGYHGNTGKEPGWWDEMIGPGKGIDTNHYHVICANILGGCKGTTGPSSLNPATQRSYGSAFPRISVGDIIEVHCLLLKHLEIVRLAAVVGGSFGGMQVLEWVIRYPEMVDRGVCIASACRLSAQALAFDVVGRTSITFDPDWQEGDYYETDRAPARGLSQARKIGHITYLSQEMMAEKFGRDRLSEPHEGPGSGAGAAPEDREAQRKRAFLSNFQVESYLEHQGSKFVDRFDANSYLHITWSMDEFDLIERFGSLHRAFEPIRAKMLIVALSADWLFPPEQSVELANALLQAHKPVSYCRLHAPHGHDAFLVAIEHLSEVMRAFMPWVHSGALAGTTAPRGDASASEPAGGTKQQEFEIISEMIQPSASVLDLGCGNGELLSLLKEHRGVTGFGVDIDLQHVIDVIDRGHDIFQEDIDGGLAMIPDGTYDYAILSETLQLVHHPEFVLREMLRVARQGIVSFPNFGQWRCRWSLSVRGRMPEAFVSPGGAGNRLTAHLFTVRDFVDLCRRDGIRILDMVCLSSGLLNKLLVGLRGYNLGADRVLVRIAREDALPVGTAPMPPARPHFRQAPRRTPGQSA